MATGKRYYWIKLKESFMASDTVDYLMSLPNGANYVVLYQMLSLKTINTNGKLGRQIGEVLIPYDVEKIQRDCKWFSADTIRVALDLYKSFGLIYEDVDGLLVLSELEKNVGSETDYSEQKRIQREKTKCLQTVDNVHSDVHQNVHTDIRDKEIRDKEIKRLDNRDIDIRDIDNAPQAEETERCPYEQIKELYHIICVSYPRLRSIDGERKKAISARWRTYKDIKVFEELFTKAEDSAFLKGDNDRNWSADFDWMMKASNFPKILEGKYDNGNRKAKKSSFDILRDMYEEAENEEERANTDNYADILKLSG